MNVQWDTMPKKPSDLKVTLTVTPLMPHGSGQVFDPERVLDLDFWRRVFRGTRKYGDPRVEIKAVSASKAAAKAFLESLDPQDLMDDPPLEPELGEPATEENLP